MGSAGPMSHIQKYLFVQQTLIFLESRLFAYNSFPRIKLLFHFIKNNLCFRQVIFGVDQIIQSLTIENIFFILIFHEISDRRHSIDSLILSQFRIGLKWKMQVTIMGVNQNIFFFVAFIYRFDLMYYLYFLEDFAEFI